LSAVNPLAICRQPWNSRFIDVDTPRYDDPERQIWRRPLRTAALLVEVPQALSDAREVARPDLRQPIVDGGHTALVLEQELEPRQTHGYGRAEEEDDRDEPEGDAATPSGGSAAHST